MHEAVGAFLCGQGKDAETLEIKDALGLGAVAGDQAMRGKGAQFLCQHVVGQAFFVEFVQDIHALAVSIIKAFDAGAGIAGKTKIQPVAAFFAVLQAGQILRAPVAEDVFAKRSPLPQGVDGTEIGIALVLQGFDIILGEELVVAVGGFENEQVVGTIKRLVLIKTVEKFAV